MSCWLMNMVNGVSGADRRSPLFAAENAVSAPSSGTLPGQPGRARREFCRGTLGLALLAPACVYAGPAAEDDDVSPALGAVLCPPPVEPVHETPLTPGGVYCTPSITWEFGEGQVRLYDATSGHSRRGWVVRDDHVLAVAWTVACDGGELREGVAECEQVDAWSLVTTAESITVGGVTAVGEWAGGCDV